MEVYLNSDIDMPKGKSWVFSNKYYIDRYGSGPFLVHREESDVFHIYLPVGIRALYKSRFLPPEINITSYEEMM